MEGLAQPATKGKQRLTPERREELILEYSPLIKYIAHRIAARLPAHVELNDLINSGVLGLIDAIERFDPSREIQFKTYAEFRIRGSILDNLRSMDWVPRSVRQKSHALDGAYAKLEQSLGRGPSDEELAANMQIEINELHTLMGEVNGGLLISLEDFGLPGSNGEPRELPGPQQRKDSTEPENELDHREMQRITANAIEDLSEKERLVIALYYYEELTMKEIGEVLKITESRVSQIHSKALLRLRSRLRRTIE